MTQIEKVTRDGDTQYFQKISTKKELEQILRDLYAGAVENGIYTDEDSSAEWVLKDGSEGNLSGGWEAPKFPSIANIVKFAYYNVGDTQYYGKGIEIAQNEHYGDWELNF